MTCHEGHAPLALVPVFRDEPAATAPETPAVEPAGTSLELAEEGQALTAAERLAGNATRVARVLARSAPKRGTLAHDAVHWAGDSLAGHLKFVRGRSWVTRWTAEGGDGKWAARLGTLHGYTIGAAGNVAGNGVKRVTGRMEVFWPLVFLGGLIYLIAWLTG